MPYVFTFPKYHQPTYTIYSTTHLFLQQMYSYHLQNVHNNFYYDTNGIECNSATVTEEIEKVDFEARKIAYEYLKLYTKL